MARLSWETGELVGTEIRRVTGSGCSADATKVPPGPVAEVAYWRRSACGAVSSVTRNVVVVIARWISAVLAGTSSGSPPTLATRRGVPAVIRHSEAVANGPLAVTELLITFWNTETSPLVAAARLTAAAR